MFSTKKMKACLSWFLLLVARIVTADELSPEYLKECYYVVEARHVGGIYVYMQPLEIIQGYPTLARVHKRPIPDKKTYYFYEADTDELRVTWSSQETWAFRFTMSEIVLIVQTETHFCLRNNSEERQYWAIYSEDTNTVVGWSTVLDDRSEIVCNADLGMLSYPGEDHSGDHLPYAPVWAPDFKMVLDCFSYMKRLENSTGKSSDATAISFDVNRRTCKYWHQPHNGLHFLPNLINPRERVCFLEEKTDWPTSPDLSLYPMCQLYLQDPKFAGLWQHDFTSFRFYQPLLRKRKITMDNTGSTVVTLHDGFVDGFSGYFKNTFMRFSNDDSTLDIPMDRHVCKGDGPVTITFVGSEYEPAVLTRYDPGLGCGPFYGSWNLSSFSSFEGFSFEYLELPSILTKCHEHSSNLHPYGQWKAITSSLHHTDLGYGPCIAFGGGLDLSTLTFSQTPWTYSCIFFESPVMIPVESCRYNVEAGKYTGEFKVDISYTNSYSNYPSLRKVIGFDDEGVAVLSDTIGLMWEEDGYNLVGLDEKWFVSFGDVNICSETIDTSAKEISFSKDIKGVIYRSDSFSCSPVQEYRWADLFRGYVEIEDDLSLGHCRELAIANNPGIRFKAFLRNENTCWAFGEALNLEDFATKDIEISDDYYSCVDQESKTLLAAEPTRTNCHISIVGTGNYDGTYIADSTYKGVLHTYPELKRYPIGLSGGVASELASDGRIYFVKIMSSYWVMRIKLDPDAVTGVSPSILSFRAQKHICEEGSGYEISMASSSDAVTRGMMTVMDRTSDFCHIIDGVYEVEGQTDVTTIFPHNGSFEECQTQATAIAPNYEWKALVKYISVCKAYDMSISSTRFAKHPTKRGTTCIFLDNYNKHKSAGS